MSAYRDEVEQALPVPAGAPKLAQAVMSRADIIAAIELGVRLGLEAAAKVATEPKRVELLEYPVEGETRAEREAAIRKRVAQEIRAIEAAAVLRKEG